MSYCLNPDCQKPHNPSDAKFCLKCGTKLLIGDRYRSLKLIGTGRFGRTLLAMDECKPSKPHCVIKQFFPQALGINNPEEATQLFQQKALRLEELGIHPQIPDLLAHFSQNQYQYFVHEFINGQNLAEELETNGAFNENQIRQLLKDVVPLLQFVHEKNVIHRDIKPKNIIRRIISTTRLSAEGIPLSQEKEGRIKRGQLVLVDFGTAKFASGSGLPLAGTIVGTSGYVAPEQALGRGTYASDLYSLGITCIHLLTRREPFELYSVMDAIWAWREHLSEPVSDELGQILDKMLEDAMRRRYQSAAEIIDDLNLLETVSKAPTIPVTAAISPAPEVLETSPTSPPLEVLETSPTLEAPEVLETSPTSPPLEVLETSPTSPPLEVLETSPTSPAPEVLETSPTSPAPETSEKSTLQPLLQVPAIIEVAPTPQTQEWQCVQTLVEKSDKRSEWYAGITSIAFSPDGKLLVSGSEDTTVKVWELSTGQPICTITGHSNFVNSIAISPDGKLIASCGDDIIKLWKLNTGEEIYTLSGHSAVIHSVTFSPDGQILASGANDKMIKLWNPNTGEEIRTLSGANLIESVCFSPDGQSLASGDSDNNINLWNLNTGEVVRTLSGHSRKVRGISFSPDGKIFASGSSDKIIKIWQTETGELIHTLTGHSGWFAGVNSVVFSPDGQTLASGSDDRMIKLWNITTGTAITTLSGHSRGVSSVAFSPDGQTIASGSWDKTVKIWQCD